MRVEKARKAFGIVLLLLLSVLWLICPACRARAEEYGRLELRFDEKAAGAELTLYSVAAYQDGVFVLHDVFEDCGVSLYEMQDAQAAEQTAEQLAALAQAKGAQGISKTVGADGVLYYTELMPAYYLLVQTGGLEAVEIQKLLIPIPYTQEDGTPKYEVSLTPKYSVPDGALLLRKVDDAGTAVEGAVFDLERKVYASAKGELPGDAQTGQDVGGRYFWERVKQGLVTDEHGEIAVQHLPLGTYRFVEAEAPEGHILNDAPNYVAVEKSGRLKLARSGYRTVSGQAAELTVENKRTTVYVNKVDESGEPVAGAKLVVKKADGSASRGKDGELLFVFTTTEEPAELRGLPAGEYLLSELVAPDGFRVSADVPFTVSDAADSVNTVTMTDKLVDETAASLTVTKTLVDQLGKAVHAGEAVYYVALFEDQERTQRVSDVKELHYHGTNRDSVTFSNLELNKKYYVGETDECGTLISGTVSGNGVFNPKYPDVIEVTPTKQNPEQEFAFQNVYLELPPGYYYGGELTITKKVLRGTEDYNTDQVFYAGVFEDAAYTKRLGDVVELDMGGGSETSVTIPVSIGVTPDSSVTYYVAETDRDGNVLDPASGLAFTVSIDKTEVEMTTDQPEQTVTITNTFPEETEPDTEPETTPHTPETPGTPGTPGNPGTPGTSSTPGTQVRTGDDTPVGLVAGCMIAAVVVLGFLVVTGRRKRRK